MRLLLDTHALIWAVAEPSRLTTDVAVLLRDRSVDVLVSTASAWEIAIKRSLGRLEFAPVTSGLLDQFGFEHHAIALRHIDELAGLPWHHRDPFDRMLVAQAGVDGLTLVTRDERIGAYDVETVW